MKQSLLSLVFVSFLALSWGCAPATPPAPTPRASSSTDGGKDAGGGSASVSATTAAAAPAEKEAAPTAPGKEDSPAAEAAASSASPRVEVATWAQAEAMIASHKGKIVVLDFWSNFCPPCLEELPKLAKIHEQFGDKVVCLSFNCNYAGDGSPEGEREAVLEVLKPMKAPFLTLISADKDVALYEKLGIASIPVVRVYGRDGKLAKQFDNEKSEYGPDGFTYQKHVHPFVEELVKKE